MGLTAQEMSLLNEQAAGELLDERGYIALDRWGDEGNWTFEQAYDVLTLQVELTEGGEGELTVRMLNRHLAELWAATVTPGSPRCVVEAMLDKAEEMAELEDER